MIFLRNFIIAPITEEICFRAFMIPFLFSSYCMTNGYSSIHVAFICPLFFGVAHIHHLIDKLQRGKPLVEGLLETTIQFIYTTIFGYIATYFFLRTGNVISPIISHCFCNSMGLPHLEFMTPKDRINSTSYSCLYSYRHILIFFHAFGILLFWALFFPFTESLSQYSIYWIDSK